MERNGYMEMRRLRYFVAVAEVLSYKKAAARVHIAVPPLIVQIRKLQTEIGVKLLYREGRGLALTDAGRVFLQQAREILAQAKRSITLARQAAEGAVGHLAIGYNTVAEYGVLPRIVRAFRSQWPNVHLTFHSRRTPQQFEALSRDELDVGFVCPPVPADNLDLQELSRQPFIAVVPEHHRLASASRICFEDLSAEPLILGSRALDPDSFHQIQQQFVRTGAVMNVVLELETASAMINFVEQVSGCCIVPDYARIFCPAGLVCKPLGPPSILRTLAIVKKKNRGALTEAFYRFAVETFCTPEAVEA
jgi:DNA-binding transcriptional LysR family regulator